MTIPSSHPRYTSLIIRSKLEEGVRQGLTSLNGLVAHGRGEAFDYLLGEKTHDFALKAITYAAMMLAEAKNPVISVNGNTAALVPDKLIKVAAILHAPLEINLFHTSSDRIDAIYTYLTKRGATHVLKPSRTCILPYLESDRKYINPEGIAKADVVFVPLEDGDRTQALIRNNKKVITVDLNPLSRTAQAATISIVDNIVRVLPLLIIEIENLQKIPTIEPKEHMKRYTNAEVLEAAVKKIRTG